jgi:hypothetical protein
MSTSRSSSLISAEKDGGSCSGSETPESGRIDTSRAADFCGGTVLSATDASVPPKAPKLIIYLVIYNAGSNK